MLSTASTAEMHSGVMADCGCFPCIVEDDGYGSDESFLEGTFSVDWSPSLSPMYLADSLEPLEHSWMNTADYNASLDCCNDSCSVASESPLLNDCMWSAALDIPSVSDKRKEVQLGSTRITSVPVLNLENTENDDWLTCRPVDECKFVSVLKPIISVTCARTAGGTWRQGRGDSEAPIICSKADVLAKHSYPSDDESCDEVDVVSLTSPHKPSTDVLVLPALATAAAHVAAVHSYYRWSPAPPPPPPPRTVEPTTLSVRLPTIIRSKFSRVRPSLLRRSASIPIALSRKRRLHRLQRRALSDGSESESSSVGADMADGTKRSLHNVLERRRRNHLRQHFHSLRDVIPHSGGRERMSKVVILRQACEHIRRLVIESRRLRAEYDELRSLNHRWLHRVSLASSNLAA